MLRRRLTLSVVVLVLVALVVTVGATMGAVQDWRQLVTRDGLDVAAAERHLLQRVAAASGGTAMAVLLLTAAAAWLVIGRHLRGITDLVGVATQFGGGDLNARMPVRPGTEAGQLATAFNSMAAELAAELVRRRRAEHDLRQFLADASHELRTPVATVRGYAELFRRGAVDDPATLRTAMARIESESARLGGLVESMLVLSRAGDPSTEPWQRVSLRDLSSEAIDAVRVRDSARTWLLTDGDDVVTEGDAAALRRLVDNLLTNVSAHTPTGTRAVVTVRHDRHEVVIEVRDDGPGLPASLPHDPFDRFVRSSQPEGLGAGLGLAIVRAIATAHGGTAEIVANHDGGLTVEVRLPRP